MADNEADLPKSGEDQYRQWVDHVQSAYESEVSSPSTGSGQEASLSGAQEMHGDTLVAIPSVFPRPQVTTARDLIIVESGQAARVKVTVRNVGPVVETYSLSIVGPAQSWVSVVPQDISLFPGDEGSATVVIRAPRASKVAAGDYTIGIIARSEVDPNESTVHEFVVRVNPFYESSMALSRTTINIRGRTTSFAQVTNGGNSSVEFSLKAMDPDGYARCKIEDPEFTLAPGETTWKKMVITAPVHLFGKQRTLGLVGTLTPMRDVTLDTPLEELKPSIQRVTIVQGPLIRFRLGVFGRILLLLLVIGAVALFFASRYLLGPSNSLKSGPPATPANLTAVPYGEGKVLLRWEGAGGATGYSVYAVGDTGDALNQTPAAAVTSPVSLSGSINVQFASFPVSSGGDAPSPSPSSSATTAPNDTTDTTDPSSTDTPSPNGSYSSNEELAIESPTCGDCTHVADVPSGTTRYLVTKVNPGVSNCYRVIATDGSLQSLYTPQECADVPAATDAAGASAAAGAETPIPCSPKDPLVDKLSDSALALTWLAPSEIKKKAAKAAGCDRNVAISGYEVQRQILSGWSTVTPAPAATDTALEITGLDAATQYCFRMRSVSEGQFSEYTTTICKKTQKAPEVATPDPSATTDPTTDSAADSGSADGSTDAAAAGGSAVGNGNEAKADTTALSAKNGAVSSGSAKKPKAEAKNDKASAAKPKAPGTKRIVVRTGDTLWMIAAKLAPKGQTTERMVNRIVKLNELKSKTIRPGQILKVPSNS